MGRRRVSLLLAFCVVTFAACGSNSKQAVQAPATSPTTTVSTSAADPYAVPATIDAAYMNRVLAAINHVRGDVRREVDGTQSFPQTSKDKLADIYADLALKGATETWSEASMTPDTDLRTQPGDEVETVQSVLVSKPGCVVVVTHDDQDQITKTHKSATGPWVVALWTFPGSHGGNPTPWKEELNVLQGTSGADYRC